MEALSVLDGGREPLSDLNCIRSGAVRVVEDVDPSAWRDGEQFLLVADGGFTEDFPRDIERELCGEGDRIVVCQWRKGEFVERMGWGFVRSVRHKVLVQSREDTFLFVFFPFSSCMG